MAATTQAPPPAPKDGAQPTATDTPHQKTPPAPSPDPTPGVSHVIHFVSDGHTAFGRIWYTGQELEVVEGSEEWEQTLTPIDKRNPTGPKKSWLLLTEDEQTEKWGRRVHRPGAWRGARDFSQASFEDGKAPTQQELDSAALSEAARKRKATA